MEKPAQFRAETNTHEDFAPFRKVIHEVSPERLPLGPHHDMFGRIPGRRWHSVTTASADFGVSPGVVARHLASNGLIKPLLRGSHRAILIDAKIATGFIRDMRTAFTANDARRHLALPSGCWDTLIGRGLIRPFLSRTKTSAYRFAVKDLDSLAHRLTAPCGNSRLCPEVMVDILDAREHAGATFAEILDLLSNGFLERVNVDEARPGLRSILIDPTEVQAHIDAREPNVVPASALAGGLLHRPDDIDRLVTAGYLVADRPTKAPLKSPPQTFNAWSVELFNERYATLDDVADHLSTDYRILRREFDELGIMPVLNSRNRRISIYDVREIGRHEIGAMLN